jgi:hypothetical protein
MKENTPGEVKKEDKNNKPISNPAVEKKNKNENSIFMKLFFHFILIIVIGIIIMKFKQDNNDLKRQIEYKNKVIIGCTKDMNSMSKKIISLKKQIDGQIESINLFDNKIIEKEREINSFKRLILDKNVELKIIQEKMLQKEDIIYTMKNRMKIKDNIIDNLNKEKYKGSDIVDHNFMSLISSILKDDKSEWRMIYKGTKNGFRSKDFHDKCDGHSNTITIISANNHTFGGFTSASWHSKDAWSYDPNAFLFSLDTKSGKFTKYNQDGEGSLGNKSICGGPIYGPCFGGGNDVKLLFFL